MQNNTGKSRKRCGIATGGRSVSFLCVDGGKTILGEYAK